MTRVPMEDELARVLKHYALGKLRTVQRIESGFVNDNWVVTTDQGRYFFKRRHPDLRRPDVIRAQHNLIRHLRQADFPAPTVIPTPRNETLLILDGEFYEIHAYIEGEPYDHNRPAHLEEAAQMLGRYHTYVQGFAPPALHDLGQLYNPTILRGVLTDLAGAWQLDQDPNSVQIVGALKDHTANLADRFARHGTLPHLVIHGDYYAGNLLFDGDRIVGVVDYDKARWQPRVVELAEALIYFAAPRPGHLKHLVYPGFLGWKPLGRFLQGYAYGAVLDESEVNALPDYVCCIWVQVSLTRLLEKGSRPAEACEALGEVLALADWAQAKADKMVRCSRTAAARRSS